MSCGYPCGPSCVTPTCIPTCIPSCGSPISYPIGGIGSLSSCGGGGIGYGYSGGAMSLGGGAASASSLGILAGANVGCVSQAPPSEIVIQRQPCVVTIPGPVLSTSCEPVRVGGYSACGGDSMGGGLLGISSGYGRMGSSGLCKPYMSRQMSVGNVCGLPC